MKRMIRDYGRNNDLTCAKDVIAMLNEPSRQPDAKAWASFRKAIVLDTDSVKHEYEPVSAVKKIKSYSCFIPWAANRTMVRSLPCGQSCCMSFDAGGILNCKNRDVTGWFQSVVHYREKNKKKKNVVKILRALTGKKEKRR